MRRWLVRMSLSPLVLGYLLLLGFMTLSQDRLLYLPDTTPPMAANLRPWGGPPLAVWPPESRLDFRGYVRAESGTETKAEAGANTPSRGAVVVFHGNAGSARDRTFYLRALEPLGLRVLLAEYPGYGGRPGELNEASLVADARETLRLAHQSFEGPLWVLGESLGAAVAAQAATDPAVPASGLVLITPWDNLPELAQSIYWYLPARWLVRDAYDTRAALQDSRGPVAMLIAGSDEIVPPAQSQRLFQALPGPKRLWVFPAASHNTWPASADAAWWGEVWDWLAVQAALPAKMANGQ